MTLFKIIKLKLGGKTYTELVHELGYQNPEVALARLDAIEKTESTFEWLKNTGYDLKYSAEEFLIRLCKLLVISPISYTSAIREAKKRLADLQMMKQPYILADTHFKRRGESLLSLSRAAQKRKILFDKEQHLYTDEREFREIVSAQIREHYRINHGELPVMGKITGYRFFDRQGLIHLFDTEGVKTGEYFSDISSYLRRFSFELSLQNNMNIFDDRLDEIFRTIVRDIEAKLIQKALPYNERITSENMALFNHETLTDFFQKSHTPNKLFYTADHTLLIYIKRSENSFWIRWMPIHGSRNIKNYLDQKHLYQHIYTQLHILASKEKPFTPENSIELEKSENITQTCKKAYADFLIDAYEKNHIEAHGTNKAVKVLKHLHELNFIPTETLINYFQRFMKMDLKNDYIGRYSWLKKEIIVYSRKNHQQ